MKYILKAYNIIEFGSRKDAAGNPHQEDCTYPLPGHFSDSDRTFVLCDGMGGHDAGEVASSTVCEAMGRFIASDGHDEDGVFTEKDLRDALNAAYDALDEKDNGAAKKMGTTMTFLKLHNQGATIAHIGDSRVYHIRPGKTGEDTRILFETSDHSLVNDLIKVGELTKEEARMSNQKNVITRAMQPRLSPRPKADVYTTSDIRPGDYFYMCSDGMLEQDDMEDGTTLRNIFSEQGGSDENRVNILRSVTDDNKDNHTAIIVHILNVTGNKPIAAQQVVSAPKSEKVGIVSDTEDNIRDYEGINKASGGKKKGVSAVIAFIVVAICVAAMIFCVRQCGSDKPSDKNRSEKEVAPAIKENTGKKTREIGNEPVQVPSNGNSSQPSTPTPANVAVPAPPSGASSVSGGNPSPAGSMQENIDAINNLTKPSSNPDPGVVESDESKVADHINSQKP